MMSNCVYIIKNFANGKIYIGKTERDAKKRFTEHLTESRAKNSPTYNYCLSRAIRKWGEQSFDFAILADNIEDDMLDIVEAHYIDMYNAADPEFGYNISLGHSDNSNFEEYREIMPNEDYDRDNRINMDDISNEDIEKFLKDF